METYVLMEDTSCATKQEMMAVKMRSIPARAKATLSLAHNPPHASVTENGTHLSSGRPNIPMDGDQNQN